MKVVEHNKCRLCGSKDLVEVFSIGDQYINDFVPKERIGQGIKSPLDLIMCNNCSLIQLKHTAPQELLYSRFYWCQYPQTTINLALAHLKSLLQIA